jgi:hypothetical protein
LPRALHPLNSTQTNYHLLKSKHSSCACNRSFSTVRLRHTPTTKQSHAESSTLLHLPLHHPSSRHHHHHHAIHTLCAVVDGPSHAQSFIMVRRHRRASTSSVETVDDSQVRWRQEKSVLKSVPSTSDNNGWPIFQLRDAVVFNKDGETMENALSVGFRGPFIIRGTLISDDAKTKQCGESSSVSAPASLPPAKCPDSHSHEHWALNAY